MSNTCGKYLESHKNDPSSCTNFFIFTHNPQITDTNITDTNICCKFLGYLNEHTRFSHIDFQNLLHIFTYYFSIFITHFYVLVFNVYCLFSIIDFQNLLHIFTYYFSIIITHFHVLVFNVYCLFSHINFQNL